ncbi:hypothetical protein AVEN_27726-1 [Araneus ventricosus]|uniref:Uncharacterized protein n=1 Tax=Araneus ventricosus TaxID=182803 RepID=A0A4Y2RZC9_ARAVE|nr:hypothetical protein AVEN_27726-1 [Araneus ventricosus]
MINTIKEIKNSQVNITPSQLLQRWFKSQKTRGIGIAYYLQRDTSSQVPLVGIPSHCKLFATQRSSLKAGIISFNPNLPIMKVFSANNFYSSSQGKDGRTPARKLQHFNPSRVHFDIAKKSDRRHFQLSTSAEPMKLTSMEEALQRNCWTSTSPPTTSKIAMLLFVESPTLTWTTTISRPEIKQR